MINVLCNWFHDWGVAIKDGLGETWLIILLVAFSVIALGLLSNILRASINKTKFVIKWGQILLLAVFILFIVWFSILL
ncbi:MAG: hypothetical protein J6C53_02650 [Clostridia bacterium]|nr:hypothetical protein [Clostridia bacterium]